MVRIAASKPDRVAGIVTNQICNLTTIALGSFTGWRRDFHIGIPRPEMFEHYYWIGS